MGSGVAGAIKLAGGKSIEEQAIAKGPIFPGDAIFTGAGTLRFKAIIHAAVMGQDLRTSDKLIRQATVSSLNVAEQLGLGSVAFPAFGTGVGGFPMSACAFLMVHTVDAYQPLAKSLKRVQFCLFDEYGERLFREALTKLRR
ncbi:Appr-1-p processing protein [candidate division GN15 bacterium]|uniref:Appr-1-p processing protein n=1 Tax=candidate division GN15 bacterium TaxID=2072418 RepID=A0A855X8T4_9BACT|nr:MAG: Appr-1-p processing protein [candidate division GN15 bacterium]